MAIIDTKKKQRNAKHDTVHLHVLRYFSLSDGQNITVNNKAWERSSKLHIACLNSNVSLDPKSFAKFALFTSAIPYSIDNRIHTDVQVVKYFMKLKRWVFKITASDKPLFLLHRVHL